MTVMILVGMTLVMSCVTADHDGHYVETFSDDLDNDVSAFQYPESILVAISIIRHRIHRIQFHFD